MATLLSVIDNGLYSALPTYGIPGRLYFCTDSSGTNKGAIYYDNGSAWLGPYAGGGSGLSLEVNGTANASQTLLNLISGSGATVTDGGSGNVTIAASGGGGSPAIFGPNISTSITTGNWTNQGSGGTRTDLTGAISVIGPTGGSTGNSDLFGISTPVVNGDFTHYIAIWVNLNGSQNSLSNFDSVLISFTDGTQLEGVGIFWIPTASGGPNYVYAAQKCTAFSGAAVTAVSGALANLSGATATQLLVVKLQRSSGNLIASISFDYGFSYTTFFTDTGPFLTPTGILVFADPRNSSVAPAFTLVSYV